MTQPRRARFRHRSLTALVVPAVLVLSGISTATVLTEQPALAAQHAATGSLIVTPTTYVGGQRLDWTGSVGHRGSRRLVLQFHMGRAGDAWTTVDGFSSRTNTDGSFAFSAPAPGMFNIRYRVKAGKYVSASQLFAAKTQDLTVRVTGQPENNTQAPASVRPGQPFGITVDTTPDNLFRSPDTKGLPVFEGRALTLQRRLDDASWTTLDTTTVGADGTGYFTGLTEPAGTVAYRVRQEDFTAGGNQIGWTPSFPLSVVVSDSAPTRSLLGALGHRTTRATAKAPVLPDVQARRGGTAATGTASQRFGWYPMFYDFAWEYGQSLTSPPERGTNPVGGWADYSDGTGRVSKHNGGLSLDSKRYNGAGPGDVGTTRATLVGNASVLGRWEARMRVRNSGDRDGADYKILAELVPANAADYDCGNRNITIAAVSPDSRQVQFGVRTPDAQWTGTTIASATPVHSAYAVAVEVGPKRITWFLNGKPVGSAPAKKAASGVPMTLRLSLEGQGQSEMNQVNLLSDWQRGFPITTGKTGVRGPKLSQQAVVSAC